MPSNYPPGVTDEDIDEAFGDEEEDLRREDWYWTRGDWDYESSVGK